MVPFEFITASTKFILRDFLIYLNKINLNKKKAKDKVLFMELELQDTISFSNFS